MQIQPSLSRVADSSGDGAVDSASSASTQGKRDGGYPAHLSGCWRPANGPSVHIRPIAPDDSELIRDLMQSLSFETRYLRFMSAVKELSPQTVNRLIRIDHRRDAALIALVNEQGIERAVGVARYMLDDGGESCEFAIVVADDWQGLGLGHRLMTLLVDTAAARGLQRMHGEVLRINEPMLAFVKELGFSASVSNDDRTIQRVERRIA